MKINKVCENNSLGVGGIVATALCCLGLPALIGFLTAIGLGFLINDFILFPLLALFLGIKLYSSYKNKLKHKNNIPFILSIIGAIMIFPSLFISIVLGYVIVGVLLFSAIWDVYLLWRLKKWKK